MKFLVVMILFLCVPAMATYKEIVVDLHKQVAYALEDGNIKFQGKISSGKRGHATPEGDYHILQKKRHHRSNMWPKPNGGAKMPYMLRLTNSGIAMHMGNVRRRAASHGCIRMSRSLAKKMYKWARVGMVVHVDGDAHNYNDFSSNSHYDDDYGVIDGHY
jgi:lipoprotein-anchoring transpeptidase ErfK/SrfK